MTVVYPTFFQLIGSVKRVKKGIETYEQEKEELQENIQNKEPSSNEDSAECLRIKSEIYEMRYKRLLKILKASMQFFSTI